MENPEPVEDVLEVLEKHWQHSTICSQPINCILQAKGKKSLVTLGRFLTNSTVGIGGLFDPATSFGWRQQHEDFDRTLETWGLGTGPYLVMPLLGPNTLRGAGGFVVDGGVRWAMMNAVDPFGGTGAGSEAEAGITGLVVVDVRHSRMIDNVFECH